MLLLKNLNLNGKTTDILIENGFIKKIEKDIKTPAETIDCENRLCYLPLNDPHVHIDSALTAGEPRFNKSGSLFEGIEIWRERKRTLDEQDFINRTNKLFQMYVDNGVQNIRAHVDITGNDVEIVKWAVKQRNAWKDKISVQIVAFPQDGLLSSKNGKENMLKAVEYGVDVLGGIPHYEFSTKLGNESIEWILDLAKKHKLLVDMHCDEIDDASSKFLEHLSAESWIRNMGQFVTASHTTAFARYNNAYVRKLWNSLQNSKISFIANPLVNIHLGGRFDQEDPGRGITRVREMIENNINVAYGHDDVMDPWYSMGSGNMMQVLFMGIHLNHLTGYDQIVSSLDLITKNSAKLMHIENYEIKEGNKANFIIFNEKNTFDCVSRISGVWLNIKDGKVINKNKP